MQPDDAPYAERTRDVMALVRLAIIGDEDTARSLIRSIAGDNPGHAADVLWMTASLLAGYFRDWHDLTGEDVAELQRRQ